jgi:hypothetical protein
MNISCTVTSAKALMPLLNTKTNVKTTTAIAPLLIEVKRNKIRGHRRRARVKKTSINFESAATLVEFM